MCPNCRDAFTPAPNMSLALPIDIVHVLEPHGDLDVDNAFLDLHAIQSVARKYGTEQKHTRYFEIALAPDGLGHSGPIRISPQEHPGPIPNSTPEPLSALPGDPE